MMFYSIELNSLKTMNGNEYELTDCSELYRFIINFYANEFYIYCAVSSMANKIMQFCKK